MKKSSTSIYTEMSITEKKSTPSHRERPGAMALAFVRQFARTYTYEPRLLSIGSLSAN
ncbi:MAG: hypothetical protein NC098_03995 [Lachnoclostridium sp.]|nr:hypothetical protein [Lachnoclostridium sp.]